ncbi:hypothetical protein BDF21DRAFT_396648 [Thamnidium elegans]|nr:hypothetical protein BDF21DRAFT_396648 [Thamnidium elegans]
MDTSITPIRRIMLDIMRSDIIFHKQKRLRDGISRTSTLICKSFKSSGHSSARSKLCSNHNFKLQELIQRDTGDNYERYTISLPLFFFKNETGDNDQLDKAVDKIKSLSSFLRNVLFKAQIFINFYIIKYLQNLLNEFFQQNFWYSLCRVACERLSANDFQSKYANIHLQDLWTKLNSLRHINLIIAKDGLRNYMLQ